MSGVGHKALVLANAGGAVSDLRKANTGSVSFALAEMARAISPRKTWGYLVSLIHANESVAKHRLRGTRRFTDEDIALMLRSERGIDYLVAIMGDAEPAWWTTFKRYTVVDQAAKMQRAARRKLQEAINADADLSAAISRAAVLQDQEFLGPHVDALSTMAGVPNSAVAAATKKR